MEPNVLITVLTLLLGSSVLVSLINAVKDLIIWNKNRKANVEDKVEEKSDKTDKIEKQLNETTKVLNNVSERFDEFEKFYRGKSKERDQIDRVLITNCLRDKCSKLIKQDVITYHERQELLEMWNLYHSEPINGNGNFNDIMDIILNKEVDMDK